MGIGRRTGHGFGYCGGEDRPGYATAGLGFRGGMGSGRGCGLRGAGAGRGFRGWLNRPGESAGQWGPRYDSAAAVYGRLDPEVEKRVLERKAEDLQIQLDTVRKRIEESEALPSSS